MRTIRTIAEMRAWLGNARAEGRSVGLVPTMGAFHAGHHSLMRAARASRTPSSSRCSSTRRSSTTPRDLAAYPRTEANDAAEAAELGVDVLFAPPSSEIYPDGFATTVQVGGLVRGPRGRRARPRALRRRLHRRQQAAEHRRAGRRVLRPEGRPAGRGRQADGARPRHAGADRGPPDRARDRRARALLAQRAALPRRPRARARRSRARCDAAARRRRRRRARRRRASAPRAGRARRRQPEYLAVVDPDHLRLARHHRRAARSSRSRRSVGPVRLIDNIVLEPVRPGGDLLAGVNHSRGADACPPHPRTSASA